MIQWYPQVCQKSICINLHLHCCTRSWCFAVFMCLASSNLCYQGSVSSNMTTCVNVSKSRNTYGLSHCCGALKLQLLRPGQPLTANPQLLNESLLMLLFPSSEEYDALFCSATCCCYWPCRFSKPQISDRDHGDTDNSAHKGLSDRCLGYTRGSLFLSARNMMACCSYPRKRVGCQQMQITAVKQILN